MTPTPPAQQEHPDDLFLITREELDRCCNQMSISGYKVSANYVEAMVLSRPHTSTPRPPCEECIYQAQSAEHDAKVAKTERERINNELDYIKHTESLQDFFVTVHLCDVRKIVRGE